MDEMRKIVEEMNLPLVLCHDDINPTNIIYNGENESCTLVDYDMTCFRFAEFDLAIFLQSICQGFNPADPSRPRRQPEFWKEALLEYLKAKAKIDGVDEGEAAGLLEQCYVRVRTLALIYSLIFVTYCFNVGVSNPNPPYGVPMDYINVGLGAYQTDYLNVKNEIIQPFLTDLGGL
ncbi:ethanolamine kinase 1-like [Lineus longissimus]|uniref:ethanolamine kinase 1-like n=1 Tax=Lineus longissimus TaxID=88925 RepID=UPI002B4FB563